MLGLLYELMSKIGRCPACKKLFWGIMRNINNVCLEYINKVHNCSKLIKSPTLASKRDLCQGLLTSLICPKCDLANSLLWLRRKTLVLADQLPFRETCPPLFIFPWGSPATLLSQPQNKVWQPLHQVFTVTWFVSVCMFFIVFFSYEQN